MKPFAWYEAVKGSQFASLSRARARADLLRGRPQSAPQPRRAFHNQVPRAGAAQASHTSDFFACEKGFGLQGGGVLVERPPQHNKGCRTLAFHVLKAFFNALGILPEPCATKPF